MSLADLISTFLSSLYGSHGGSNSLDSNISDAEFEGLIPKDTVIDNSLVNGDAMGDDDMHTSVIDDSDEGGNSNYYDAREKELLHDNISFSAREDMLPYDQIYDENNLNFLYNDPFGVYALHHHPISTLTATDIIPKPSFGEKVIEADLQELANKVFDAFHVKHVPVMFSMRVDNAAYDPGILPRASFDDAILINPNYAQACVDKLGSTDILISDLAHEIGHYVTQMKIGRQKTFLSEKLADFISGFIDRKLGVDIEVARQWFQWYYDPEGIHGYPVSENRWDIQAAGHYYAGHATFDDMGESIKDEHFIELVKLFSTDNSADLAEAERLRIIKSGSKESKDVMAALGLNTNQGRSLLQKTYETLKKNKK